MIRFSTQVPGASLPEIHRSQIDTVSLPWVKGPMPWIIVAAVLALPVVGIAFLRPVSYRVQRSIRIARSRSEVFEFVRDLNDWRIWSPWLYVEPTAAVVVEGDGKSVGSSYTWEGELVGKGLNELVAAEPPARLDFALFFARPFKARAWVTFEFTEVEGETEVSWTMEGRIPSVMRKTISAWCGMDFERGLAMLKSQLETGGIPSETEVIGVVERPPATYLGVDRVCTIDQIGPTMENAFGMLKRSIEEAGVEPVGPSLAIYRDYDLVTRNCAFTAAVPVDPAAFEKTYPEEIFSAEFPAHRAFEVVHTGPFDFLANGWATGFQHVRHQKLAQRSGLSPYEIYARAPENTPPEAVRTEIYFPVKG